MGLRYRKSVTLCKGVRLNFGLHGMSVTTGTKGFHNTYNFGTGRRTTSVGIPGTGLSYVTTSGGNTAERINRTGTMQRQLRDESFEYSPNNPTAERGSTALLENSQEGVVPDDAFLVKQPLKPDEIISTNQLTSIHYKADPTIDWTEVLIQDVPPADCEDEAFWRYCHEKAYEVLNGNIDTYLQIIQDIGPLDDLLDYGFDFECGTDNSNMIAVEFQTKEDQIMPSKNTISPKEYYLLLQDYICSCAVRVARDMFALLPIARVIVHASDKGSTVLSVLFERKVFMKTKFQGSDASDLVNSFRHNMQFDHSTGFSPVSQLER